MSSDDPTVSSAAASPGPSGGTSCYGSGGSLNPSGEAAVYTAAGYTKATTKADKGIILWLQERRKSGSREAVRCAARANPNTREVLERANP